MVPRGLSALQDELLTQNVNITGGSKRGAPGTLAPGSKFFHFHAVLGKKKVRIPTLGVGAPPQENPRYATEYLLRVRSMMQVNVSEP